MTKFIKMHGLGNSYIYLNGFERTFEDSELKKLAIQLSKPCKGIGADGIILMAPSQQADIKMRIFNKDGSEGKNCGNGLRCVAKYAYEEGLVASQQMTIETLSGCFQAVILEHHPIESLVSIQMRHPQLARHEIPMKGPSVPKVVSESFVIDGHQLLLTAVSVGNPHAVFFVKQIQESLHATLGPKIEKDPRFPDGVNVEFVEVASPQTLHFRVWERGSGITQACGTGACAAVVAAVLNGYCKMNVPVTVHLEGGDLVIEWNDKGIKMTGSATRIAVGEYTLSSI